MKEVVIVDGVRTAIGRHGGGLASIHPDDLLAHTYRAWVERSGIDPAEFDDVYAGCGNQAGEDNRDVARISALLAGLPGDVARMSALLAGLPGGVVHIGASQHCAWVSVWEPQP
jgi:acetyl-CoA acyltransferase